jgi:hypothetical protein
VIFIKLQHGVLRAGKFANQICVVKSYLQ